jgi:hypothetical protein
MEVATTTAGTRWPRDTAVVGIIIDAEHVEHVATIIRSTINEDACALLAMWRRQIGRFPFCVFAGQLHRRRAGLVGGLAADWQEALNLHAYARARFDSIAAQVTSFSSAWGLHLTDERRDAVLAITAATQPVGGRA